MERLDAHAPDALARVTAALDAGELCVVPTDVGYALVADALNDDAVLRVFDLKRRGADRALPVCVGSLEEVHHVATTTPLARELADAFWPGPLALVLRAKPWLPDELTAGSGAVAVRCPRIEFTRSLARQFGPFAATSARRDGGSVPLNADEAAAALGDSVTVVVDAGPITPTEITVVDATESEAKVLREGTFAAAEIAAHGPRGH